MGILTQTMRVLGQKTPVRSMLTQRKPVMAWTFIMMGRVGISKVLAWGENIGWIIFKGTASVHYKVRTTTFDPETNGTPNWWLEYYRVEETKDEDLDGVLSWQEYVADTDPTNVASYFWIEAKRQARGSTDDRIVFESSPKRYYSLQQSTSLLSGSWEAEPDWTDKLGTGGIYTMQCTNSVASQRYYRVNVEVTP